MSDRREKNGIVYTCKAGHVDITHVRIAADHTRYLVQKSYAHMMRDDVEFSFGLRVEPSRYFVKVGYPAAWEELPAKHKTRVARSVSIRLGQYLGYVTSTWHEILVWFGYKCMRVVPEFPSAFSWEDSFSNLLGTHLAVRALEDLEYGYDKAMTVALKNELEKLGVQPRAAAIEASEQVRGKWFTGNLLVDIKKRNLDIGLDDGYVTPMLVPCVCEGPEPEPYPVPSLDVVRAAGFDVRVEIEPREWEADKILSVVFPDGGGKRIEPAVHFQAIMDYIAREAMERYGFDLNVHEDCGAGEN
jgi:hypothetical protein